MSKEAENMNIVVTSEHIKEVSAAINLNITDLKAAKKYIKNKVLDEVREDGATRLCILIENIIVAALEDAEDFIVRPAMDKKEG